MPHHLSSHKLIAVIDDRFQTLTTIQTGLLFDLTKEASVMRDGMEVEDIHHFRVATKKLRAFLRLAIPGRRPVLPGRLREYYRSLGVIRDLQLQEQRLQQACASEFRRLPGYSMWLRSQLSLALKKAAGLASDLLLPNARSRILADLPGDLGPEAIRDFVWKSSTAIRSLLGPELSDEQMHQLRKILKDLSYNHRFIADESAQILPPALTAGKEKIEPLLLLLGRFQDYCTAIELLGQSGDDTETKLLAGISREWEKEKEMAGRQFRTTYVPMLRILFSAQHHGF